MKPDTPPLFNAINTMEPKHAAVVLMVTLNAFSTPLMLSATNVALPTIADKFSLTAVTLSWVPMSYLMASAMFILIFGRIADLFGRKRIFLLGTIAVIASSIFTALSINSEMLLLGRFLQGASAAMLYATQIAIVSSVFRPDQRGKAIGLVVSAVYVGLAAGPLLGGIATDWFGWRANFLLHIPLALVVVHIGITRVKDEWFGEKGKLDLIGAALFSGTIVFLCLGITSLPSQASLPLLALFLLSLALFVRHVRAITNPIWDIRLFLTNSIFTRACGASLIMYTATYANVVLLSLYLQQIKSLSGAEAGVILMIQPISMAVLAPLSGRLSDRIEPRLLASAGMALTALGLFFLSTLTAGSQLPTVALALAMTGIGFSFFSAPNTNAIMGSVERKDYGSASGALATTRILGQLGSMVLVTFAMSIVVGDRLIDASNLPALEHAIQLSFGIASALCLVGFFLSITRGKTHQPTTEN